MKRIRSFLLILLAVCLLVSLSTPAVLAAALPRLCDHADLLTPAEESRILAALDKASEAAQADLVIVTEDSIGGQSPRGYADDFFDYNGYGLGSGRDGVLLLIVMDTRDWYISTSGVCINMFGASDIDALGEAMVDDLGDGDYADAFETFIDECAYVIDGERNGYPFDAMQALVVSVVVGLLAAFVGTGKMKADLKSVRRQSAAGDYVKPNSMNVTESQEIFLYRNVSHRERQTSSGSSGGGRSHTSSSGRSHGGGGGKF